MNLAVAVREPFAGFGSPARASSLVRGLFPSGVAAAELREGGDASLLLDRELAGCAGASAKRLAEFAAGRVCARRALAELDAEAVALTRNEDRSPAWPAGFTGSITHTLGFCAAAVASRGAFEALGLDAEIVGRVTPEIWPYVFTPAEFTLLEALPRARRTAAAALVFSAKEAFYKCQHVLTGEWLDFVDVTLELDGVDESWGSFTVRPLRPLASQLLLNREPSGRFRIAGELVVTGIAIEVR
jgi:4'-phosphopantetheinyl transferase EntD